MTSGPKENSRPNRLISRYWAAFKSSFDLKLSHWVEIFLTCALVGVGYAQYRVYERQATISETANSQNALTNRAFVTSNEVNIEPEVTDGKVVGWMFRAVVVNSGNTPTQDLTYYATGTSGSWKPTDILAPTYPIDESPSMIDPEQGYYNNIGNPGLPDAHLPHLVLGPHASTKMGWIELTAEQMDAKAHGKWAAYISATIHYKDRIEPNKDHITRFCYVIRTDSMISDPERPVYDLCEYWNCIDDECKTDNRQYRAYVARAFKGKDKPMPDSFFGEPVSFLTQPTQLAAHERSQELARLADKNSYLPEKSLAVAQARSAELWNAVRCHPQPECDRAQVTTYLLPVREMTDGTAALIIPPGTSGGIVGSNLNGIARLTTEEQSNLRTAAEVGKILTENNAPPTTSFTDGTAAIVFLTNIIPDLSATERTTLKTDEQLDRSLLPPHYRYRLAE